MKEKESKLFIPRLGPSSNLRPAGPHKQKDKHEFVLEEEFDSYFDEEWIERINDIEWCCPNNPDCTLTKEQDGR